MREMSCGSAPSQVCIGIFLARLVITAVTEAVAASTPRFSSGRGACRGGGGG